MVRVRRTISVILALLVPLALLRTDTLPTDPLDFHIHAALHASEPFNFVSWELQTIVHKLALEGAVPQDYLSPQRRSELVREYIEIVRQIHEVRAQIQGAYSRGELDSIDRLENKLNYFLHQRDLLRDAVEGIIEEQVSQVLIDAGLGRHGYVWPPVKVHLQDMPHYLVVSPRDEIRMIKGVFLQPDLPVSRQEAIEDAVDRAMDVSSLVVPIGGLSVYPTMILDYPSIPWFTDTTAHEWTHLYLAFYPLGYDYLRDPWVRSINETVASIVGEEVGWEVIRRYYSDLYNPPPPPSLEFPKEEEGEPSQPEEPQGFDFNREMRITREEVDRLLAVGRVEEAEAYMEQRRQLFVEHGYNIRKLNQAYFAFYGAYATSPSTSPRVNPVGIYMRRLRLQMPDLRTFLLTVREIDSFDAMTKTLEAWNVPLD